MRVRISEAAFMADRSTSAVRDLIKRGKLLVYRGANGVQEVDVLSLWHCFDWVRLSKREFMELAMEVASVPAATDSGGSGETGQGLQYAGLHGFARRFCNAVGSLKRKWQW
jgi:hypothetical protein